MGQRSLTWLCAAAYYFIAYHGCSACLQVAVRNNQQGVLYFTAPFKAEVLSTAPSNTSSNDFFVSLHCICPCR